MTINEAMEELRKAAATETSCLYSRRLAISTVLAWIEGVQYAVTGGKLAERDLR
jgi:hypothetical protein